MTTASKTKTKMTFDIRSFLATAVSRDLHRFQNLLRTNNEHGDPLATQPEAILKSLAESLNYPHLLQEAVQLFIDSLNTFERWGYWNQCEEVALAALELDLPPQQKGYLHTSLGQIYYLNRNFADSLQHLDCARIIAEEHAWNELAGLVQHRLMNIYLGKKEPTRAKEHGLRALVYLSGTKSKTLAASYNSLGLVALNADEPTMAEAYFWDALALWDLLKDYLQMARSYLNLGVLFSKQDNMENAQKCYQLAQDVLKNTASTIDKLKILNGLGILHHLSGQWMEAEEIFRPGLAEAEKLAGSYHLRGSFSHNLGNTLLAQGRLEEARTYLEKANIHWQQANDDLERGNTVGTLAEVYETYGQWETAVASYDEALTLLARFPDHPWAKDLTKRLAAARKKCADRM